MVVSQRNIVAASRIFFRRYFPVVAWLLVAAWAQEQWSNKQKVLRFTGQVMSESWEASGVTSGMLKKVNVELFAPVEPGQVLAVFDDAQFIAELEVARKELTRLKSQVKAVEAALMEDSLDSKLDWDSDLRRFQVDVQRFRVDILDLNLQEKELVSELRREQDVVLSCSSRLQILEDREALAESNLSRLESLADGIASVREIEEARLKWLDLINEKMVVVQEQSLAMGQVDTLKATLNSLQESSNDNQNQLDLAQERMAILLRNEPESNFSNDPRILTVVDAVNVQSARIDSLAVQYQSLQLKAESAGIVRSILAHPGQSILAGEPVLVLAKSKSSKILGWIPESLPESTLREFDFKVDLFAMKEVPIEYVKAGPAFEELPQILWGAPGVPEYGRPVLFKAPFEASLTPGQKVEISAIL